MSEWVPCARCGMPRHRAAYCACATVEDVHRNQHMMRTGRSMQACPFRGYFEFYETAREFPSFARTCGDPFDWVAYYALATLYQHYRPRYVLGMPA